ncbi:serine hydrolase domain-containing protein [Thaumasiovibrio subtropicus]|uniref:serine hydrolase domain-containing protein n=1 Tax=Thaumasiovibrio subtropicus TaxID=1891207 RepID=UPI000B35F049|nr:serine hydrolase domain-containing protein [Thaumasiovibrio subtropicus]
MKTITEVIRLGIATYALCAMSVAQATTTDSDYQTQLSQYISQQMNAEDVTGLSIALVKEQEILWAAGFGYADKRQKVKAEASTLYRAGSVSKLMTATAIMQLVEQDKIALHTPLTQALPGFTINTRHGNLNDITIERVLNHHAGLPTDYLSGMWAEHPMTVSDMLSRLEHEYTVAPVDTIGVYSNVGYSLLGEVIGVQSGIEFNDYMQAKLLGPMGMKSADFNHQLEGEKAALGYQAGRPVSELPLRDVAAGGMNASVLDLAQVVKMVNGAGSVNGQQVLSAESIEKMLTVTNGDVTLDYDHKIGLGWHYIYNLLPESALVVGHDGATIAHRSVLLVAPEQQFGIVVMANDGGVNEEAISNIAEYAMQLMWARDNRVEFDDVEDLIAVPSPKAASVKQNFAGHFVTPIGLVKSQKSKRGYRVDLGGETLLLERDESGVYRFTKELLGLIPISLGELEEVSFESKRVDNLNVVVAAYQGYEFVIAQKVAQADIPVNWMYYLGDYELVSPFPKEVLDIRGVRLEVDEGFLLAEILVNDGDNQQVVLAPIDDDDAVIAGLGRALGDNIHMKRAENKIQLHYSGLVFEQNIAN